MVNLTFLHVNFSSRFKSFPLALGHEMPVQLRCFSGFYVKTQPQGAEEVNLLIPSAHVSWRTYHANLNIVYAILNA